MPTIAIFFGIIVRMLHQAELLNNWEKAQHFKPLDRIQGADRD